MLRKFPPLPSERKKRSTFGGTPQFPNGISGKLPYYLTPNRNFRIFWPNGKRPLSRFPGGNFPMELCVSRLYHAVFKAAGLTRVSTKMAADQGQSSGSFWQTNLLHKNTRFPGLTGLRLLVRNETRS